MSAADLNPAADAASETIVETSSEVSLATGDVLTRLLGGDLSDMEYFIMKWMVPNVGYAGVGLAVLFVGYFFAKYASRMISQPIRQRIDETFGRFVGTSIFYCIMGSLVAAVASKLGAPLGGVAALLAAAGFAIGLAFQGTLSNFAAGVLMIVFRPFKVGDMVNVAGVCGRVNEIDLFITTLDTPDNRRLIIPNSSISGATIENISFHAHRRVEVLVGVDYSASIDDTRQALQAAVDRFSQQTIHGDNRGTAVVLAGLGDSAVQWKVRMWVASNEYWSMTESLTAEVKRQLDLSDISIPFPQMDIHLSRIDDAESRTITRPRLRPSRHETAGENRSGNLPYAS